MIYNGIDYQFECAILTMVLPPILTDSGRTICFSFSTNSAKDLKLVPTIK